MPYKYVKPEYIQQRLVGRLYFENPPVPVVTPTGLGTTTTTVTTTVTPAVSATGVTTGGTSDTCPLGAKKVDPVLFDRIIRQKEMMLENYLNMIYITPLQLKSDNTLLVLSEIVEHLVVAELIPIYYRAGSAPQTGVEPSSLAGNSDRTARELIQVYITGHNIYVPGTSSQPNIRGGTRPQPVVLPGEYLKDGFNQPDTISRSEGYVGTYSTYKTSDNSLFDFTCI